MIVRTVAVAPAELAGEIEVVDTGDVLAFTDSADLVRHLLEILGDEGR